MAHYGVYDPDMYLTPYHVFYNVQDNFFPPGNLHSPPYYTPSRSQAFEDGKDNENTGGRFEVTFDVSNFTPEMVKVTVTHEDGYNVINVEAKQQETEDENDGMIPVSFIKKRTLPKECDVTKIQSEMSSDGVLTIWAPSNPRRIYRNIPILQTGEPSRRGAVQSVSASAA